MSLYDVKEEDKYDIEKELKRYSVEMGDEELPNYKFFCYFENTHLQKEVEEEFFIARAIVDGDYPWLRTKLFNKIGCSNLEKYPELKKSLEKDIEEFNYRKIEPEYLYFPNIYYELYCFRNDVANLLKNADNPEIIEEYKSLLPFFDSQEQIEIMKRYVEGTTAFCKWKMADAGPSIRDFIYSLFNESSGKYSPIVCDRAVGVLLLQMKKTEGWQQNEEDEEISADEGEFAHIKRVIDKRCGDKFVEKACARAYLEIMPQGTKTLDNF